MTQQTEFVIPHKPVPASRPRVGSRGTFYPKAHMEYHGFLKDYLKDLPPCRIDKPCEVRLLFVFDKYKTSDYPTHRNDVDNLSKLPLDSITKAGKTDKNDPNYMFWQDDALVVSLCALKRFVREGEEPHTKVKIKVIEDNVDDYVDEVFNG